MSLIERAYKNTVRPRVFAMSTDDAETAHEWGIALLYRLERNPLLAFAVRRALTYSHPMLETQQFGVWFPNPLGLAAGFDKYCQLYRRAVPATGWGFAEVGGITPMKQDRNPHIRMRRSEEFAAIWNFMGFNNPGADMARLQMQTRGPSTIPIGLNVGKGKDTPLEKSGDDYAYVITRMFQFVQFITINVSSPNTKGLRGLQAKRLLDGIVKVAQDANRAVASLLELPSRAMGIKVSPDETDEQLADIADIVDEWGLGFLILTNTTVERKKTDGWNIPQDKGGVSGRPLLERSRWVLMQMAKRFPKNHRVRLISVGGIDSAKELYHRILLGASLCQVYTAWPFEGPDLCKRWLRELVGCLQDDKFDSIDQAIGAYQ